MTMSRRFAVAGALALAVVGGAMSGAALARGGGGGGGAGGEINAIVAPPANIQVPPRRVAAPQAGPTTTTNCRYDLYNITRECERLRRYW